MRGVLVGVLLLGGAVVVEAKPPFWAVTCPPVTAIREGDGTVTCSCPDSPDCVCPACPACEPPAVSCPACAVPSGANVQVLKSTCHRTKKGLHCVTRTLTLP